jgi:murein DD-endopeptidase MepM/ murein hydrolase activator NlpD
MFKRFAFILLAIGAVLVLIYYSRDREPSLTDARVYPVSGKKADVGSVWGDERDGGRRRHQGIDIFARKGTAVVAIEGGVITSREETRLGGKVLWLRPQGAWWRAYYAHLDEQLVKEGDHVYKGQVIGTVGNTGNAKTTPAHLHFGIYTLFGAIDPLPVVRVSQREQ